MSEESKDDKEFDASEQKLRKAREKGDIPRSTEANAAFVYIGAGLASVAVSGLLLPKWVTAGQRLFQSPGQAALSELAAVSALIVLIAVALPGLVVLLGLIVQRGMIFTPSKLNFDIKRINPVKNFGQKFGKTGLVNYAISVGKVTFVGIGGWFLFGSLLDRVTRSAQGIDRQWTVGIPLIVSQVLWLALGVSVLFAGLDLLWKHFDFRNRNRMTRREMKDEHKDSEGDPHLKQARRQRAVDIAMNSMLADVEKADVVIVNPTHYAVALEWKRGSGRAPVCVAKGVDQVAARIRERARDHNVPIWSDPPVARAIHATVDIGAEIKRDHFAAVAAAIRFAEAMREKARQVW